MTTNGKYDWLVLLYLAGDNNLTEDMVLALQTLAEEGPPPDDVVVAQLDPSGMGLPTQTYAFEGKDYVGEGMTPKLADKAVDLSQAEINTGNPDALTQFVERAAAKYPAKHILLILSGHGSGSTEDFLLRDENSMDAMSIDELKEALKNATQKIGKRVDILGMDACYMSMGEVCYEIRDYVDILVGAEGLEPDFGWPYSRILAQAKKEKEKIKKHREESGDKSQPSYIEPQALAKLIVLQYVEFYSEYDRSAGRSVDLAAIHLERIRRQRRNSPSALESAIDDLAKALKGKFEVLDKSEDDAARQALNKIVLAHWYAQTYKSDQYVDLFDLCQQLQAQFKKGTVFDACETVMIALRGCVLLSGCSGFAYQHSHGLSIYFPWALVSADYNSDNLEFARDTQWDEFLAKYVKHSCRGARNGFDALDGGAIDDVAVKALATAMSRARIGPLKRLLQNEELSGVQTRLEETLDSKIRGAWSRLLERGVPARDIPVVMRENILRGSTFGPHNSRHTMIGSRHTMIGSRYPGDRENAVKNLPPVSGMDFWP